MIKVNGEVINYNNTFPDGTMSLRLNVERNARSSISWYYESDYEMAVLFYITSHLRSANNKIYLYMPYIPNARMDRVKNPDEIFTLKYFAEFINALHFERVFVRDPHSNVSCALIDNLTVDSADWFPYSVLSLLKKEGVEPILYYPDEGAMKRYSELEMLKDIPYTFGIKKRDWRTGKIEGIMIADMDIVKGKDILIVDDICSKGGTFYYSAKALKTAGANDIYLYVTHCENTIFKGELINSDLIKHIYTTRSVFTLAHEKITVLKRGEVA